MTLFNLAWSGKQNLIRKGIPDLLAAVAILKKQNFAVALKLAGLEGDGAPFLRDLIVRHDIRDEVELLGAVDRDGNRASAFVRNLRTAFSIRRIWASHRGSHGVRCLYHHM